MSSYLYEVRYGLLLALITLVWISLEYAVGLHTTHIAYHSVVTNLFAFIPIALMWRAVKHRRDVLEGGSIHWWQGIMSGLMISVVTAAFGAPTMWFFSTFVNPKFFQSMVDYSVASGAMKADDAFAAFNLTAYAFQATLMPLVAGVITSIILTAIARRGNKEQPAPTAT